MGAARLEVVAGNAAGMSILVEDELLIGRHAEGAGRLADDDEISRAHARVTVDAGGFGAIEDLGSTNGTFVNGLRISAPQTLSQGDTIEIGSTTLVVREVRPTEATPPTPQPAPEAERESPPTVEDRPPPPAPADPMLSIRLQIDFAAREAQLVFDDAAEPVRLVFETGEWRPSPTPPDPDAQLGS